MNGLITNDGATYLLNLFSNGEAAVPVYYVALITGNQPGISIAGDELDEPAFPEYARGMLTNESGNWSIDGGVMINMVEVDFPIPSTGWGDIKYWAICDDPTGGRCLFVGTFDTIFTVVASEQPYIGVSTLSIDLGLVDWKEEE